MGKVFTGIVNLAIGFLAATTSQASAVIKIDPFYYRIEVKAHHYFYGPAASEEVVRATLSEINRYWNGGFLPLNYGRPFKTSYQGRNFEVIFTVTGAIIPESMVGLYRMRSTGAEYNFIRLEVGGPGKRSFMNKLCSNSGTWFLSDQLGSSTTAAHEFGHGICLPHHAVDWRTQGQPGIMCARGAWVDPVYQWDPFAAPGSSGGTLNPGLRKVIQTEIDSLNFGQLKFDRDETYEIKETEETKKSLPQGPIE